MVRIQRPTPRKGQRSGAGAKTFIACRNVIMALAVLQVLSLMYKFVSSDNTFHALNTPDAGHSPPKDIANTLRDSIQVGRQNPKVPDKKPPTIASNVHRINANLNKQTGTVHDGNIHDDGVHNEPILPNLVPHHNVVDPDEHVEPEMPVEGADPDHEHEQRQKRLQNDSNHAKQASQGAPINEIVLNKQGSGPTKVAYVKDFVFEFENPEFRNIPVKLNGTEIVEKLLHEAVVKPCQILQENGRQIMDPKCLDTDTALIVYNSANFPRTWCGGTEIKPYTAVQVDRANCDPTFTKDPVHIFAASSVMSENFPPISGQGMSPMIVKSHDDAVMQSDLEDIECDIPCKHEKGMDGVNRYIDGQNWSMTFTMQDSWSSHIAKIDRINYRIDQYYSTQSFKSSVPLTYFDFAKHGLRNRPAVDWETTKNRAIYLVESACSSQASKRNKYFHATAAVYPVDAMGTCNHNTDVPEGHNIGTIEGRINIMKQYRMVLALDPNMEKDHITDVVWEAFLSGSVPVVVGAENIRSHMPPNSMICSQDFKDWDELAAHVKEVANNKTLWESYHKWRSDEDALKEFEERYEFTRTNPTCRTCRWAYAKMYGLGWDHEKQQVRENTIPRYLCTQTGSSSNLVSQPFKESWVVRYDDGEHGVNHDALETCEIASSSISSTIDHDAFKVHRTVSEHDGVTDIAITGVDGDHADGEIAMRLAFPNIRNSDGASFPNTHSLIPTIRGPYASSATIQDEMAKITVLANWPTTVSSPELGVIEVVIHQDKEAAINGGETRRIRVIIEDSSILHDKMSEFFPSSFAKVATKDFIDPLELYYADSS